MEDRAVERVVSVGRAAKYLEIAACWSVPFGERGGRRLRGVCRGGLRESICRMLDALPGRLDDAVGEVAALLGIVRLRGVGGAGRLPVGRLLFGACTFGTRPVCDGRRVGRIAGAVLY